MGDGADWIIDNGLMLEDYWDDSRDRALGMDKPELIKHMLESLETPSRELTKWEQDFIDSVREQFNIRHSLSDRQIEILDRVYAEKTS